MKIKSVLSFIAKSLFSALLLLFLFNKFGLDPILNIFKEINWIYVLPFLMVFLFALVMECVNMKRLADAVSLKIPFFRFLKYYFLNWGVSQFFPGNLGNFSIVLLMKKEGIKIGEGTAIMIADKIISLTVTCFLGLLGILFFISREDFLYIILIFILLLSGVFLFFFNGSARGFLKKYVLRKHSSLFEGFFNSFRDIFIKHPKVIIINVILRFFKACVVGLFIFLLFKSLNYQVPLDKLILLHPLTVIATFIPISLNGLGIREYSATFFFGLIGVPSEIAFSAYFLSSLVGYLFSIIMFLLFLGEFSDIKRIITS